MSKDPILLVSRHKATNSGWQSADSAPKDGRFIILAGVTLEQPQHKFVCQAYFDGVSAFVANGKDMLSDDVHITHWMPVPPHPDE